MLGLAVCPSASDSSRHTFIIVCHGEISRQTEPHPRRYLSFLLSWELSGGGGGSSLPPSPFPGDAGNTVSIWGHWRGMALVGNDTYL